LVIWGWFYLGSQATTSEYGHRTSGTVRNLLMLYLSPGKQSAFLTENANATMSELQLSNINSMYNAYSIVSGDSATPQVSDLNGAAKVPYILANGYASQDGSDKHLTRHRHGYYDVSQASEVGSLVSYVRTSLYTLSRANAYEDIPSVNNLEGHSTYEPTYFNVTC
jgi:hypothetical protein